MVAWSFAKRKTTEEKRYGAHMNVGKLAQRLAKLQREVKGALHGGGLPLNSSQRFAEMFRGFQARLSCS